jgi:hypothetical protein
MTNSKLRIDLPQGLIEVEGSEAFVLSVYSDFKDRLAAQSANRTAPPLNPATGSTGAGNESERRPTGRKSKARAASQTAGTPKSRKGVRDGQSIVKELDLTKGKHGRLKDFYAKYDLKTNMERNLVFVYYMQNELDLTGITDNHVFTCYRDVSAKLPGALRQSLADTASRNGWLDTSDMENIRLATQGINFLEHDLPKAGTKE